MQEAAILTGIEAVYFFLGIGGMIILFFRWRSKQDRLAQVFCLTAFATWVVAVIVASTLDGEGELWEPATVIAAIALGLGLIGAGVVLLRP